MNIRGNRLIDTYVTKFLHDARDVSDLSGHFGSHRVHLVADVKTSDSLKTPNHLVNFGRKYLRCAIYRQFKDTWVDCYSLCTYTLFGRDYLIVR